jgi:hypothetical protein
VERFESEYKHQPDARIVHCGKQEWDRFRYNIKELLHEAKKQIHVGLPMGYLVENAQFRQPTFVQIEHEMGQLNSKSGLILPNGD